MKKMKRQVSLVLLEKKDKGTALQVILYTVWLLIFLANFRLYRKLFISPIAGVLVFC
jgi:protoheme IX farnesyltransferase